MTKCYTVRVPAAQAPVILDALIARYARKADALAAAARAYRATREPPDALASARDELIEAEAALDAFDWRSDGPAADVELAGRTGAVREVLYASLLAAARAAYGACRDYKHGRIARPALAAAVADVEALHRLFAALEDADAPDPS